MIRTGISVLLLLAVSGAISLGEERNETLICKLERDILDMSHRRLKQIPSCEELDILDRNIITKIDLGNNNITVFEYVPLMKKFPNIESLYLPNNKIKFLNSSEEILKTKVKTLDLGKNMIEHVEAGALNNIKLLQHLYLNHNRIKHLPKDVFHQLDQLTMIDLRNNKLPTLKYNWFSGLLNLEKLYLSNNDIENLDQESFEWQPSLCELNVSRNKLKMMPPFLKCERESNSCFVDFTHNPTYCSCRNVIYKNKCNVHSQCGQSFVYSDVPVCKKLDVKIVPSLDGIRCQVSGVPPPTGSEIFSRNTRNEDIKDTTTSHLSKWSCSASNYFGKVSVSLNLSHCRNSDGDKPPDVNYVNVVKTVLYVLMPVTLLVAIVLVAVIKKYPKSR